MLNPVQTSAVVDPFDMVALKRHLRIDGDHNDEALRIIARAAVTTLQDYLGVAFLRGTYKWYLESFVGSRSADSDFWFNPYPDGARLSTCLYVPVRPLVSVTSIEYKDSAGALQAWSAANYQIDTIFGRIAPINGVMWPTLTDGYFNRVQITYVGGHALTLDAIPERLQLGLSMLTGHWYEHRESHATFDLHDVPVGLFAVIDEFKNREGG